MTLSRRSVLKSSVGAGALLIATPGSAFAGNLTGTSAQVSRESRVAPGTRLVHADMHNHSLQSDGAGDPALAFLSMRDAGVDVAALTDHATVSKGLTASPCAGQGGCQSLAGLNETTWARTKELADAHLADQEFVALRGFEWSSPTLGHMNVWFSDTWTDPVHTGGVGTGSTATSFLHPGATGVTAQSAEAVQAILKANVAGEASMAGFQEWLGADPARPVVGGGRDALTGFNHPGREPDRFGSFTYAPTLRDRVVSCEVFNRGEDYLFEGTDSGQQSPINECLNAGWQVGLFGVSDEHGTDWGFPDGKGRTGMWVSSLTREGVREAMEARRGFSTRLRGLRIDATADGVRMGQPLTVPTPRTVSIALDVDHGPAWYGKTLVLQVLRPGPSMPVVARSFTVTVPRSDEAVITVLVEVDPADGPWLLLRLVDPTGATDSRATGDYAGIGTAVAYTSPWFLTVDAGPVPVVPEAPLTVALPVVAVAGMTAAYMLRHRHAEGHSHPA